MNALYASILWPKRVAPSDARARFIVCSPPFSLLQATPFFRWAPLNEAVELRCRVMLCVGAVFMLVAASDPWYVQLNAYLTHDWRSIQKETSTH